jgi:predicted RNA-binding Zn-ribbon protein involved in translation (DUF1610 family)
MLSDVLQLKRTMFLWNPCGGKIILIILMFFCNTCGEVTSIRISDVIQLKKYYVFFCNNCGVGKIIKLKDSVN